jgi:hypothetical protein
VLATVLAIVAIVLSGASLGWQMLTWRQAGAVVTVIARQSFPAGSDDGEPYVEILARNKGRSAVTVNHWGLMHPNGGRMGFGAAAPWSASCPHRLEPGASDSWFVPTEHVVRECRNRGLRPGDLLAWVGLGDGRQITAANSGIGWKQPGGRPLDESST